MSAGFVPTIFSGLQGARQPGALLDGCFSYVSGKIVTVKDFGAKGDGTSDDTAAVQAAFTAAAAGLTVVFTQGTYSVTGVTLAATGAQIWGQGGATLFLANGANKPVLALSGSHCSIVGLKVDGNRANNVTPGAAPNACIYITGNDNLVERCQLVNGFSGGVYVLAVVRNRVALNEITACSSPIAIVTGSDNVILGNACDSNDYGIFLYNNSNAGTPSSRNVVANNSIRNCAGTNSSLAQSAAISMAGAPDSIVIGNVCADNASIRGIECFSGSTGSVISDNQILRNGVTSGSSGIDVGPDNHISIRGNYVEANGGAGIFLSGTKYCVVATNICRNNAQNATARAAGGANGITLNEDSGTGADPVTENIITGNHCIDTQGGGATQPFGIKQWTGLASYYVRNVISGNNVRANATAGLSILSVTDSIYGNVMDSNSGGDYALFSTSSPMFIPYSNVSSNTTLTEANYRVTVDASGGNVTVTLPASPKVGREYMIRRIDSSGNTATISAGALTINGVATFAVAAVKGFRVFFNGGGWFTETT